jgi:hypothetical protein
LRWRRGILIRGILEGMPMSEEDGELEDEDLDEDTDEEGFEVDDWDEES